MSGTLYFPEQARRIMRALPSEPPAEEWAHLRARHVGGDEQIRQLWRCQRALADSYDDLSFRPPQLARVQARTLIVYGDRDPLYPVSMALEMYQMWPSRREPRGALRS